jgi:hypothetical protein
MAKHGEEKTFQNMSYVKGAKGPDGELIIVGARIANE